MPPWAIRATTSYRRRPRVRPTRLSRAAVCLATSFPGIDCRTMNTDRQMILAGPDRLCTEAAAAGASRAGPGECRAMALDDELALLGYRPAQEKRDGTRTFSLARNRFLTYWLHLPADDGEALFTQVDVEVPQDMAEVVKAMERTEAMFAGMNFGHRG